MRGKKKAFSVHVVVLLAEEQQEGRNSSNGGTRGRVSNGSSGFGVPANSARLVLTAPLCDSE